MTPFRQYGGLVQNACSAPGINSSRPIASHVLDPIAAASARPSRTARIASSSLRPGRS
jgi:hypothetical protein